jgi:hypothetical protein
VEIYLRSAEECRRRLEQEDQNVGRARTSHSLPWGLK